jgi:hypothetical protein
MQTVKLERGHSEFDTSWVLDSWSLMDSTHKTNKLGWYLMSLMVRMLFLDTNGIFPSR